ncbi:MAG TPA: Stf0 family sulfotransferase [Stellaceae bacterium]|nr:Stf0 family sulfotransferase [Stellaceae bacterium]
MIRLADCFPDTPAGALPLTEFDWARSGVAQAYVIFITGRCGSTLLTHLLAESGLCGNPDEFFNEERIVDLVREWGVGDFPSYFRAVVRHSVTNRRFGFEIDPFRFAQFRELVSFPVLFPPHRTVFFWMTRRDIVSQGWSFAKAKKTGLWHRFADGSEKRLAPLGEAGGETISDGEWWREIIVMLMGERLMEDYFAAARITPYRLDYEMLVTDRLRTVIGVLQALSCGPDEIARHLGPPVDRTERNRYSDWHGAMIRFCDRYRNELRYIDRHRNDVDIDGLRQELNTRYALGV